MSVFGGVSEKRFEVFCPVHEKKRVAKNRRRQNKSVSTVIRSVGICSARFFSHSRFLCEGDGTASCDEPANSSWSEVSCKIWKRKQGEIVPAHIIPPNSWKARSDLRPLSKNKPFSLG